MIKFTISTSQVADSDWDWLMQFNVLEQDQDQMASVVPLEFEASNEWTVKSTNMIQICKDDREIFIRWNLDQRDNKKSNIIFKKKNDMLRTEIEISEALKEWVESGWFKNGAVHNVYAF